MTRPRATIKATLRRRAPRQALRAWGRLRGSPIAVPPGRVRFGDLDRVTPIDRNWGYARGGPLDRYYIERFLGEHRHDIRGRVLEVGDDAYTRKFGSGVTRSDVLHVSEDAPGATYVGDLADSGVLPSEAFDAIVLTQTLHLIFDYPAALRSVDRALRPGGVLLLTVPGITPVDSGEWGATWHYSFSDHAVRRMCEKYLTAGEVEVQSYGNALVAVGFLHGLGVDDVGPEAMEPVERTHSIVHAARVRRSSRQL